MRLIDADKTKQVLRDRLKGEYSLVSALVEGAIVNLLDEQPTAYDVDKVLNELAQNSEQIDEFEEYTLNKLTLITRRIVDSSKAIDIVKRGR